MEQESSAETGALKNAAERVAAARASDKDALWIAGAAAGIALLLLDENLGEPWAIIVLAAAFGGAYRIAKIALYRMRGLGWLPLFGDLLPHTVSPVTDAAPAPLASVVQQPRSALVPRLPFSVTWHAAWIATAKIVGVTTLRGGRTGTNYQDLPLGVFLLTERGLAFLPEARGKLEELVGEIPAAVITQIGSTLFEPVEFVERWNNTLEAIEQAPTLAEWMQKALASKHAFAISWGDLTGVVVGATHTLLTRQTADGALDDFIILDASPSWPGVLMQKRIVADLKDVVFVKVLQPKSDELAPEVRRELATDDAAEINAEASRRAMEWFSATKPPLEQLVLESMAPALEGYAMLPNVVTNQPWLFEKKDRAS
jgi:hypothetical protein